MKIKTDKHLSCLANAAGKTTKEMGEALINSLLSYNKELDDMENWGSDLMMILSGDTLIKDLIEILKKSGIEKVTCDLVDEFMHCELEGNGNCPCCGGDLKLYDKIGHVDGSGDYYTPGEWIVDEYIYTCPICGEIVKSEKEL